MYETRPAMRDDVGMADIPRPMPVTDAPSLIATINRLERHAQETEKVVMDLQNRVHQLERQCSPEVLDRALGAQLQNGRY